MRGYVVPDSRFDTIDLRPLHGQYKGQWQDEEGRFVLNKLIGTIRKKVSYVSVLEIDDRQ